MRKLFVLVSVVSLLLCLLPTFQAPVRADNENPNAQGKILGPWNITVAKSFKDLTIEVGGNITIKAGGTLKLDHTKLIMNSTKKNEYYITVELGGTFQVLNNSTVTNNATFDKPYFLTASYGSTVQVQKSQLSRMGNTSASISLAGIAKMGFFAQSSGVTVTDSVISDSFAGTVCTNLLLPITPTIKNVTYRNDSVGLAISMNCNPTLLANVFIKDAAGLVVLLKGKSQHTSVTNDRFYNDTMAVGATGSSVDLNGVVVENSTVTGLGAMAGSAMAATKVVLRNNKNATFMDNSSLAIDDSLVTKSGLWDFFVNNGSTVKVTNTTIDSRTKIKVNDTKSDLELMWHLNVKAQFKNGTPLSGAYINVTDALGKWVFGTITDSKGWSGQILVTELSDRGKGAVHLTPHNVTAEKGAYWNLTKVPVDHTQDLVLNVWQRDIIPPKVTIDNPADGGYVNTTKLIINGTASDNSAVSMIEVSNGTGWTKATGTTAWSGMVNLTGDGAHQVCARATDTSKNNATSCVSVTLDTVPPHIAVTEPSDGTYFNHSQLFVKGTSDGDVVQVGTETVVVFDGNFSYPLTLSKEGENDIVFIAKDKAGNQNRTTLRLFRDLVAPTITVISPKPGAIVPTNAFAVAGNVTDAQAVAGIWGSSDNKTWKAADVHYSGGDNTTGTFTASFSLPEGNYTIYLKATDRANNTARVWMKIKVKLPDATPPTLAITDPKDGQRIMGLKVWVNGTARDNEAVTKVEVSVGGTVWDPVDTSDNWTHWSLEITLLEGTNTIWARGFDAAGNKVVVSITVTAVKPFVDTEKPSLIITSPKDGSTVSNQKVVIRGQVTDNVKVKSVLVSTTGSGNNANWILATLGPGNNTWSLDINLKTGWNQVAIKASDNAGNTNITNVSIKYVKPQSSAGMNLLLLGILLVVILVLAVVYVLTLPGRDRAKKVKDEDISEEEDTEEE